MRGPFARPEIQASFYLTWFPSQIMGVTVMRFLMIAGAAALLLLPAIASANACGAGMHSAQAATADYSAAKKKAVKKVAKKKTPKVEYMRAVPMK